MGKLPAATYAPAGPRARPRPEAARIRAAAEALLGAERPILVAGGGAVASEAREAIVALAQSLAIPVLTSLSGRGAIGGRPSPFRRRPRRSSQSVVRPAARRGRCRAGARRALRGNGDQLAARLSSPRPARRTFRSTLIPSKSAGPSRRRSASSATSLVVGGARPWRLLEASGRRSTPESLKVHPRVRAIEEERAASRPRSTVASSNERADPSGRGHPRGRDVFPRRRLWRSMSVALPTYCGLFGGIPIYDPRS